MHQKEGIAVKLLFVFFLLLSVNVTQVSAYEYRGFTKLNPDECTTLEKDVVLSKLPIGFSKYTGFVKICNLINKGKETRVSIVSVWAHEYLDVQPPKTAWENFPLPIIVDNHFKPLGYLQELYPSSWVTDLNIYYGKWRLDIPTEIRVDVENPAVSGDYYYPPLIWNEKSSFYEIKGKGTINGRRPQ